MFSKATESGSKPDSIASELIQKNGLTTTIPIMIGLNSLFWVNLYIAIFSKRNCLQENPFKFLSFTFHKNNSDQISGWNVIGPWL